MMKMAHQLNKDDIGRYISFEKSSSFPRVKDVEGVMVGINPTQGSQTVKIKTYAAPEHSMSVLQIPRETVINFKQLTGVDKINCCLLQQITDRQDTVTVIHQTTSNSTSVDKY